MRLTRKGYVKVFKVRKQKMRKLMLSACAVVALCVMSAYADDQIVERTVENSRPAQDLTVAPPSVTAVDESAPAADASNYAEVEIGVIKSITLIGAVDLAEEEGVQQSLEAKLVDGQVKKIADLEAAFADVRKGLAARGYYLAALYPASDNAFNGETGELQLIFDAGYFGNVTVDFADESDFHWYSKEQIEKRVKDVKGNETFNYGKLRTAISNVNYHPDLVADTKISVRNAREGEKGDSPYTRYADIDLSVKDSFPLHFVWDINNYGMDEIDEWQSSLTVQYLNLTRADDVLTVTPAMSFNGDLKSISSSYMRPFDWWRGMSGTVYGGYSSLDSDDVLPQLALEGTGWFAGFNWSANLYDDDKRNFAFNAGVLYRYIEDEWSVAAYKLKKREVGILPLTVGFSYADKKGDWLDGRDFFHIDLSYNLASTEDDLDKYTDRADEHYMILRAGWQRLQPLFASNIPDDQKWRAWSLFTKVEGQFTDDVLISAERLAYGGYNCLRGYRARGYLGDSGVYGTAEFRTPVLCDLFSSTLSTYSGSTPIDRLQFLVFTDLGWINFNDSYPNMEEDEFLFSAGFGARMAITKYTSFNCDVAFPLNRAYAHEKDEDIEVYLSAKVLW